MTMRLYRASTSVSEFNGHREVTLHWFVDRRTIPAQRPYAELIADYDPAQNDTYYLEDAIDELFSADEVAAFVGWLKDNRGATDKDTAVDEAALPIASDIIGFGAIAVGGPQDFLCMAEVAGAPAASPLGFTVLGYYDLRASEPIDKSVPARHQFPSITIAGGRMVTDYAELLELWRAGRIMANDEFPHIDSADNNMPF
jgi:hypothetical protein